jgi:hemerythrin
VLLAGIVWNKRWEVGISPIDAQHRTLVQLIRRVQDSIEQAQTDPSGPVVGAVLKELVHYAHVHFEFEQQFMTRMRYSGLADHLAKHRELTHSIRETLLRVREGGELTKADLVSFLQHWLVDHILAEDMKVGREFREKHGRV